jgi:diaminopimelate decarboxylase
MSFSWADVVQAALSQHSTPFYLSAWAPVEAGLEELSRVQGVLPIRNWLSFKTHPVAPLIRRWRDIGLGVEVVSEFEFLAAVKEEFDPSAILINGVAKHTWLSRNYVRGSWLHFDSLAEVEALKTQAYNFGWNVGLRCHVSEEYDPDEPRFSGQFGMSADEFEASVRQLRAKGIKPQSVHFHLGANVRSPVSYLSALKEVESVCRHAQFDPIYVDIGGGLPVTGEWSPDAEAKPTEFDLHGLREVLNAVPSMLPSAREIWLENGRFITARSAVLVIRVVDVKERSESRYLICDGGRTNHALVSDWESHEVFTIPQRTGTPILTTICGPTCMAFDRLIRIELPDDLAAGDFVVWMNAGAYHIPWETRFSHGLCKVLWYDEKGEITLARHEERFQDWWREWE